MISKLLSVEFWEIVWFFFVAVVGIALITHAVFPFITASNCREGLIARKDAQYSDANEVDYLSGRTMGNHWITAYLMQPKSLDAERYTLLCHFEEDTNPGIVRVEKLSGNRLEEIRKTTTSNLNPIIWLEQVPIDLGYMTH